MMARKCWVLVGCALLLNITGRSEGGSRWRVFRAADGLANTSVAAVTVSPRGTIWAKHASGSVSWLDGFQARSIPFSGEGNSPVYESRSAQIWSAYSDGVMEYRRDQWLQYPVGEIRSENESSALRLVRPIPLLPAERDHVLALLPDRLLEFDCGQNRTAVLRFARETELGRFNDLVEARDGGAWVSGANGIAKLPGPVRRLTAASPWQQFRVDPQSGIQNLERPFEDEEGGVTLTADSPSSGGKVLLYFDGQTWTAPVPAPEKTRFAWRDLDGAFWAMSRNTLWRRHGGDWEAVPVPGLRAPQFYDVATEPSGAFWLATTEGLVRRALQTWRAPAELSKINLPVCAILDDAEGGLWFAGATELFAQQNGQRRAFKWPDGFVFSLEPCTSLHSAPDGNLIISSSGRVWRFEPATGQFDRVVHPGGKEVTAILGEFKNRTLCAQTAAPDAPDNFSLESFDGANFKPFFTPKPDWSLGSQLKFLRVTEDGLMWLGGDLGLATWDPKARTFVPMKSLPQTRPVELIDAGKGRIWYATADFVSEFNGRAWSVAHFGLGRIRAMTLARDGSAWIATDNGLYRYADGSWVGNSAEEGLPSKDALDIRQDRRGDLWAATSKGVSLYHRAADLDFPVCSFSAAPNPKQVYSSEVAVFSFFGQDKWDYTRRDRLLFSHRVDEAPWSPYSSETSARLTNAAAGKHRLYVRAMDRNWNEEVQPQFYEFASVVPWFREPRVLAIASCSAIATLLLAWLAVNRHLRLLRSYADVEKIVAQRTSELERANQELLHSQKMRALGTLAAGIAHDFNSILSIIRGSAQIIETHLDDREKIRTRVDRIKTMVEQGSGIVKAMLGFSRAEQVEKPCDVNQLVAQTTKLLSDQFQNQVTLEFTPSGPLPPVRAVGELIQQMLLNLILNAADAMNGRGQIVLRAGVLERAPVNPVLPPLDKAPLVYVSVRDEGCGIAPDILPRIFEPFYTTKAFSTRRGTGLGLSMVYEIAKELGYGLMVESAKGKGSNFTILIPVWRDTQT